MNQIDLAESIEANTLELSYTNTDIQDTEDETKEALEAIKILY